MFVSTVFQFFILILTKTIAYLFLIIGFFPIGVIWFNGQFAYANETNLISNGEFEIDSNGDNIPDSWQTRGSFGMLQELKFGTGHDGGRSAQLIGRKYVHIGPGSHFMLCQKDLVSVKKGNLYRLTFWAKQSGMKTGSVSVALRDTKAWCGLNVMFNVEENKWQKYNYLFKSTRDCSTASRFQFWHRETGVLWIDDVRLEAAPSNSRTPGNISSCEGCKNLVPNSGFECGLDGWGSVTLSLTRFGSYGGLDGLIGRIDSDVVYQGLNSMKIELSPETFPLYNFDYFKTIQIKIKDPLLANIGWIPVTKGQEYILSAYLKASHAGLKARMGISNFPTRPLATGIKEISTEWKRYNINVKPEREYCFVIIGPDFNLSNPGQGTLWIDNVQFEKGGKASNYAPSQPVEMGLHLEKIGNIYTSGESIQLDASFQNADRLPRTVECTLELFDFFDNKVKVIPLKKTIAPGTTLIDQIDLGELRTGFFILSGTLRWDGGISKKKLRLAVVPPRNSSDSMSGVNHAYGRPHILRLAKYGGIDWCRTWSLKWQEIEPVKGDINFSLSDMEINRLAQEKMKILGLIPLPSNNWSSSAPSDIKPIPEGTSHRIRMSFAPRDKNEFIKYVKSTVQHYKDRIEYWQIFNEPLGYSLPRKYGYESADYAFWVKEAWHAAREADPSSKILVGFQGLGRKQLIDDFKDIFEAGIMNYCDIITVHCYPLITPPEKFEESLEELNNLMEKYGEKKPIWVTEHGYYGDDDFAQLPPITQNYSTPLQNEKVQAAYAVRFAAIQHANGVQKIFYHSGITSRLNQENIAGTFFEYGGEPRKIYSAIAAFNYILSPGAVFLKKITIGNFIQSYLFSVEKKLVLIAWKTKNKRGPVLALENSNMELYDFMSNIIPAREITLSSYPVYVVGTGISAKEFETALNIKPTIDKPEN